MDTFIQTVDPQTGEPAEDGKALRGYRFSRGWASDQKIYFYAEFSEPFDSLTILRSDIQIWKDEFRNMPNADGMLSLRIRFSFACSIAAKPPTG